MYVDWSHPHQPPQPDQLEMSVIVASSSVIHSYTLQQTTASYGKFWCFLEVPCALLVSCEDTEESHLCEPTFSDMLG